MSDILPDCMMPDGTAPCRGYHQQVARANHWQARAQQLEEALRRIAAGDDYSWIRLMAWKTHRAKYGPKGHGGRTQDDGLV